MFEYSNVVSRVWQAPWLIVLVFSSVFTTSLGNQAAAQAEKRIHVLMIADTNDPNIGKSVQADVRTVLRLFEEFVPVRNRVLLPPITGNQVTPQNILDRIQNLAPVAGVDTLLVYYSGHGAYDPVRRDHYIVMNQGRETLFHANIMRTIEARNPRLTVFINDACSKFQVLPIPAPFFPPPAAIPPLFQSLFFDPAGRVHLSSTRPGEVAIGNDAGGLFTFWFCMNLQDNANQFLTWSDVLRDVNNDVKQVHPNQTAYAVQPLPAQVARNEQRLRFGVTVDQSTPRARQFGGVEVVQVIPGSPATRILGRDGRIYTLAPNQDIITHINNRQTRTHQEFGEAVRNSPREMILRVVDLLANTVDDYTAQLEPVARNVEVPSNRLGVSVARTDLGKVHGGVEVKAVRPNSPGTRIQHARTRDVFVISENRDIITHINGNPITTEAEFEKAVAQSERELRLRVFDSFKDERAEYIAELPE